MTVNVWAISDTHLSFDKPRDQTRFGEKWRDHEARIAAAWRECILPDDIVLMPGDLSWAHTPQRVLPDIEWVSELPGRKVLVRGNHDYWWKRLSQVQREVLPNGVYAVQGSCLALDNVLVCGTMGHIAPNDPYFQKHKLRSYHRELRWLESALKEAEVMRTGDQQVVLMLHYPPFTSDGQHSGFTELVEQYQPDVCVYGHLHFEHEWEVAVNHVHLGTHYHLVACDFLDMVPLKVWPQDTQKYSVLDSVAQGNQCNP